MSDSSSLDASSGDEYFARSSPELNSDSDQDVTSSTVQTDAAPPAPKVPLSELPARECRATQTTIRWDLVLPGEPLAFDAEFQTYRRAGEKNFVQRLARPALVNTLGQTVVDAYIAYARVEGVKKGYPPKRFSVEPEDLLFKNGAVPGYKMEGELKKLMQDRTIVVHDKKGDIKSFFYDDHKDAFSASNGVTLYDTQEMYSNLQSDGTPALSTAYEAIFHKEIQVNGIHSPVEDARATMELFRLKYPYDRAAEAAKLETKRKQEQKKQAQHPRSFASKPTSQVKVKVEKQPNHAHTSRAAFTESTVEYEVKVKERQGKAKRSKSAVDLENKNSIQAANTATASATFESSTRFGNTASHQRGKQVGAPTHGKTASLSLDADFPKLGA